MIRVLDELHQYNLLFKKKREQSTSVKIIMLFMPFWWISALNKWKKKKKKSNQDFLHIFQNNISFTSELGMSPWHFNSASFFSGKPLKLVFRLKYHLTITLIQTQNKYMRPGKNKPEFIPSTGHIRFTWVLCTNETLNERETSSASRLFHWVLN